MREKRNEKMDDKCWLFNKWTSHISLWNTLTTICQLMSNQYWIDCGVIAGEEISSGSFVWWRSPAKFLSFFSSSKRQIPTDFNQRGNSVFWSWWIENSIDAGKYSSSYIIWVSIRRRVVFWNVLCGRHSIALSRHAAICWQRNDWECPSGRDLKCKSILSDCGVVKIQFADLPIYLDNTLEESSAKICAQPTSADVLRNILFIAAHCGMFPDMTKVTASDINNIASMFVIKTKAESLLEMQGPQEFLEEKGLTSSETTSCAFGEGEREREKAMKRERTRASNTGRQDFNRQEFSGYRRFIRHDRVNSNLSPPIHETKCLVSIATSQTPALHSQKWCWWIVRRHKYHQWSQRKWAENTFSKNAPRAAKQISVRSSQNDEDDARRNNEVHEKYHTGWPPCDLCRNHDYHCQAQLKALEAGSRTGSTAESEETASSAKWKVNNNIDNNIIMITIIVIIISSNNNYDKNMLWWWSSSSQWWR